jgi:hypothetical protein
MVIRNPSNEQLSTICNSIIDTGSEITFIPEGSLIRLNAQVIGPPQIIEGIGDSEDSFYPYAVLLGLSNSLDFRLVEVFGWERKFALLGRDWLQDYCIKFDGPCGLFEVMPSNC